ncbi:MAG: autotransporter outer membrane beta-barrel domain-containing protein, partial [Rickettsiales bacterium]|nr:autotransporter outer membrane beta-barrel domain-containing protein [Rickettsiales bacterium]
GWVASGNNSGALFFTDIGSEIEIKEDGILQITDIIDNSQQGKLTNNGTLGVIGRSNITSTNKSTTIGWADAADGSDANTGRLTLYKDEDEVNYAQIVLSKDFNNGTSANNERAIIEVSKGVSLIANENIINHGTITIDSSSSMIVKDTLKMSSDSVMYVNSDLIIDPTLSTSTKNDVDFYNEYANENNNTVIINNFDNSAGGKLIFADEFRTLNKSIAKVEDYNFETFIADGLYSSSANANTGILEIAQGTLIVKNDLYNNGGDIVMDINSQIDLDGNDYHQTGGNLVLNLTSGRGENGYFQGKPLIIADNAELNNVQMQINTDKLTYLFTQDEYVIISSNNLSVNNFSDYLDLNGKDSLIEMEVEQRDDDVVIRFILPDSIAARFATGKNRNEISMGNFLLQALKGNKIQEDLLADATELFLLRSTADNEINEILNRLTLRTAQTPIQISSQNAQTVNSKIMANLSHDNITPISLGSMEFMTAQKNSVANNSSIKSELSYMANQYNNIVDTDEMSTIEEKIYSRLNKQKNSSSPDWTEINGATTPPKIQEPSTTVSRTNMWAEIINTSDKRKATENFSDYSTDTNGFVIGLENAIFSKAPTTNKFKDSYKYGMAVGVSQSESSDKKEVSSASFYDISSNNLNLSLYGSATFGKSMLTGIASYNLLSFEQDRNIMIDNAGLVHTATANTKFKSSIMSLYGEYKYNFYKNLRAKGFANYSTTTQDGFEEVAAGIPALGSKQLTYNDANIGYGIEYATYFFTRNDDVVIMPYAGFANSFALIDGPIEQDTYFVSVGPNTTFKTYSEDRSKTNFSFNVGLSIGQIVDRALVGRFDYTMDIFEYGTSNTFSFRISKALN